MRGFIRLSDYSRVELFEIFDLADEMASGKYAEFLPDAKEVFE